MIGVYATVVRPRLLRWGATADEVQRPYPADDLVPGGSRGSTMAVTIDAPPRQVWPWLVQMGHGRAGWYSWDRLDNFGAHSADRIHPEWQDVSVGDRLQSTPDGSHWFDVAALDPERFLALRVAFDVRGRQIASGGLRPPGYHESVWCFLLKELPGGRTRLVVTVYASGRERGVQALARLAFWEPAHWIMQRRQFTNLRRRADTPVATGPGMSH
jgi:proline iminopeptidase